LLLVRLLFLSTNQSVFLTSCFSLLLLNFIFFLLYRRQNRDLHSFPTRRSSDLDCRRCGRNAARPERSRPAAAGRRRRNRPCRRRDRKSTRLNSSHVEISYAVFCLKKKKFVIRWFLLMLLQLLRYLFYRHFKLHR